MAIAAAAARSVFRSSACRTAAAKFASQSSKSGSSASSAFRLPSRTPLLTTRIFRSPVELSACLDSLQPYHTATASALMTSMLTVSPGFSWLSDACNDDV